MHTIIWYPMRIKMLYDQNLVREELAYVVHQEMCSSTNDQYVPATVAIREVYRYGKKGEVRLSEGFNYWRPSELTSQECEAILTQLPN